MENSLVTTDDLLSRCVRQYENAADATVTHRREAERARDYYDGKQWTTAEIQTLEKRKQPVITDNRIADKVQYLLGMERKSRSDPKAYPRNPADEMAAEAATDAIRYVFDCNHFQQVRSAVFENMLIEGPCALEVIRENDKERIRRIRWDRFYWDPHSMELDFSDALYLGVIAWMDDSQVIKKYPNAREKVEGLMSDSQRTHTDTHEDKPADSRFVDFKRRRIQLFEHYFWEGQWSRAVFMKGAFLEEPVVSPYVDEYNVPECPILAQCAYRDRDGNPYGVVRRYKDLQDEINKRRSKALHALSARRVVADRGAVEDVNKARIEVQRPDGWIEVAPGARADVESNTDIGMAQFQLLGDAIQALATTGPNEALQGNSGNISGKAKQVDQEGGSIQVGALFDQIRHLQQRVAEATWNRIKQFWTAPTWIRITDDEQKLKFVGLNVPVTQGQDAMLAMLNQNGAPLPPDQHEEMARAIASDPMSSLESRRVNDVSQMHVDIIIDESADVITLQQEQFQELVNLASAGVVFPPEVYIQASSLRNKDKLIELMKGGGETTPEQQAEAQKAKAIQDALAQATVRKATADAAVSEADIGKTQAETQKLQTETAVMVDTAVKPEPPAQKFAGRKPPPGKANGQARPQPGK